MSKRKRELTSRQAKSLAQKDSSTGINEPWNQTIKIEQSLGEPGRNIRMMLPGFASGVSKDLSARWREHSSQNPRLGKIFSFACMELVNRLVIDLATMWKWRSWAWVWEHHTSKVEPWEGGCQAPGHWVILKKKIESIESCCWRCGPQSLSHCW